MSRKTHCRYVYIRICRQQCLKIISQCIVRLYGIKPIRHTTEYCIETVCHFRPVRYPWLSQWCRQLRHDRHNTVPYPPVMGTSVSERIDCFHPTFKNLMLGNPIWACYLFLDRDIRKIEIQFGQATERQHLSATPLSRRRRIRSSKRKSAPTSWQRWSSILPSSSRLKKSRWWITAVKWQNSFKTKKAFGFLTDGLSYCLSYIANATFL